MRPPVGGWMETGEQPWEAAARETLEEIGLAVRPQVADVYPATSQYFPESGVHSVCLMVRCNALLQHDLSDLVLEPGKVSAVRWASPHEARALDLFGHVRAYLDGKGGF
jgi:8-oxo-dGTP pyrophosphatase MutT (NUDIX family)